MAQKAADTTDVPIGIVAFDRPRYLERICLDPTRIRQRQVDAVSKRTGHRHGRLA